MLRATRVISPTLPSQLGSPPLTLLLMPPGDLRSPIALKVRMIFLRSFCGLRPTHETQTHNTSNISQTGAPHPSCGGSAWSPDLLAWVHVRSHVARVTVPPSTSVCVRACVCACMHMCAGACERQSPHGSRLEAEARVSQIHFLAEHGWGKGQTLFVSPHIPLSPSPGKPNLLKAQNVCAATAALPDVPGPAGVRAALRSAAGAGRMVTHSSVSGDLLYRFLF